MFRKHTVIFEFVNTTQNYVSVCGKSCKGKHAAKLINIKFSLHNYSLKKIFVGFWVTLEVYYSQKFSSATLTYTRHLDIQNIYNIFDNSLFKRLEL